MIVWNSKIILFCGRRTPKISEYTGKKRPRMERFTWEDLHKKCWVNFQDVQTSISQYLFQMAKKYLLRLATNIGFSSKWIYFCSFLKLWFNYKDHILKNKFHLGLKKKGTKIETSQREDRLDFFHKCCVLYIIRISNSRVSIRGKKYFL